MAKTLTLTFTYSVSDEIGGTTSVINLLPKVEAITTTDAISDQTFTLAPSASAVAILPTGFAVGDQVVIAPTYAAGSSTHKISKTVTISATDTTEEVGTLGMFQIVTGTTAVTLTNPDATNSVEVRVLKFRRQ